METIPFRITRFHDGTAVVTAYLDRQSYTVSSENDRFDVIVDKLRANDDSVVNDFDAANMITKAFHGLTDRVSLKYGVLYMDDEPVSTGLGRVIVEYLREGNPSAMPLIKFMERLDNNPSHRSREQLYRFVDVNGVHIDDDGYMVLYKSVLPTDEKDRFSSVNSGTAFVNGEKQTGQILSRVGDVVSMPRREISDDPTHTCHAGLHCGAREYATGFFGGHGRILITVRVDPAHVVAVPTDHSSRKIRVEQYTFMEAMGDREVNTVRWPGAEDDEDDEGYLRDDDF